MEAQDLLDEITWSKAISPGKVSGDSFVKTGNGCCFRKQIIGSYMKILSRHNTK